MKRFLCHCLYKYKKEEPQVLLSRALSILGFEPKYMNIYFDEFEEPLDDIAFDEDYLFSLLKRNPGSITIKSELYDENKTENYFWFRFKLDIDTVHRLDTCSLEWSNDNLDFLLNSGSFQSFFSFESLIYCYCYDQMDCMQQSDISMVNPDFDTPWQTGEITREFILNNAVDISEHWGRYVSTRGIRFMAAPLMWFGKEFFKIIPKEELLKFKDASLINHASFDIVYIVLFDLYDTTAKKENRAMQKEFWKFFDLQNKIDRYEKDNPIDALAWLKARVASKKKQKKNR
jgi:hypothetical protein